MYVQSIGQDFIYMHVQGNFYKYQMLIKAVLVMELNNNMTII